MKTKTRRGAAALATVVLALVGAATSRGDGGLTPSHSFSSQSITVPSPTGWSCGAFRVLLTAQSDFDIISFRDDSGRLVTEIRHVSFSGTLYNSADLTKTVAYDGHFTRTFDAIAGTNTFTGLRFRADGVREFDAGRSIFQPPAAPTPDPEYPGATLLIGQVLFLDGNQTLFDFVAGVCSALD